MNNTDFNFLMRAAGNRRLNKNTLMSIAKQCSHSSVLNKLTRHPHRDKDIIDTIVKNPNTLVVTERSVLWDDKTSDETLKHIGIHGKSSFNREHADVELHKRRDLDALTDEYEKQYKT